MKMPRPNFEHGTGHSRRGSTLMEVLVASGIGMVVLLAMMSLSYYTARGFSAMGNYADLDRASRFALDQMTRDIRGSSYLISSTTNELVFNVSGATNLTFKWDPAARTVTRSEERRVGKEGRSRWA